MRDNKIEFKTICMYTSLLIYASVILVRPYLITILGSSGIVSILPLGGIFLLILAICNNGKINKNSMMYILLLLLVSIPFFYKNAYIEDGIYNNVVHYLGTIVFCMLISTYSVTDKEVNFIFKIFVSFAVLTSLVTWFSFIFPERYDTIFISMLPHADQLLARNDFWFYGMKMGLANHYSRNAFYLILGVLGVLFTNKKNYSSYLLLGMFFLTLLLVGKRGHFVFIVLSLFISYLICGRWNITKLKKIIKNTTLSLILFALGVKFVPGASNFIERMTTKGGVDISTGRFELYQKAWVLYQNNNYKPIGWNQFAKSTQYFFAGVHNDYLQLFYETGFLGLGITVAINIIFLFKTIRLVKQTDYTTNSIYFIMLTYQIFFMTYSLTGLPHYDIETYMVYFLLVSFLYNYKKRDDVYV